ncbi:MAG: hypothetical protein KF878_17065 [Planctomycetes bacterium]|nr:hypothetical protein [Planctomycetota bacterium]MCW8140048.1 hypothetical protein [Planctomycetota bacterium]
MFDRLADWNLDDFLAQLHAVRELGSVSDIVRRVPGLDDLLREEDIAEEDIDEMLASAETILLAMAPEERRRPELLAGPDGAERRTRVAIASGTSSSDVEALVAQFLSARDHLRQIMEGSEAPQDAMAALWRELSPRRREPTMAIPEAETFSFEERVDDVLRKIALTGLASLTTEEKSLLDEASRFYRKRRDGQGEDEEDEDGPGPDLGLDSLP